MGTGRRAQRSPRIPLKGDWMKRLVAVAAALIVVLAPVCALSGCGSDEAKARSLAIDANRIIAGSESSGSALNSEINAVITRTFASSDPDKSEFEAGAARITKMADELIAKIAPAGKDFEEIRKLKRADKYAEYAAVMLEIIDLNEQEVATLKTFLDELGKMVSGGSFDQARLQQFGKEAKDMADKVAQLEQRARKLEQDNNLL